MKAQKVICKHSREETEKTASLGLSAAEHPWELGGGKLGKLQLLPVAALAIDPHPLAQRIIILFRFCSRRAIEPNEEIRTILGLHQTLSPSPEGPHRIPYTSIALEHLIHQVRLKGVGFYRAEQHGPQRRPGKAPA